MQCYYEHDTTRFEAVSACLKSCIQQTDVGSIAMRGCCHSARSSACAGCTAAVEGHGQNLQAATTAQRQRAASNKLSTGLLHSHVTSAVWSLAAVPATP